MVAELEPVWQQLGETYDALRQALADLPAERLDWRPGPETRTAPEIVQHIVRGNGVYAGFMERGERGEGWHVAAEGLPALLEESQCRLREVFERMPLEALRQIRAEDWNPLGPRVEGPLDALWFALQMVRHSAYHLGQLNVYLLLLEGNSDL